MAIKFSNLASTTLASGVSSTATSVSVTSASSFPTLGSGDYFYATIGAGSGSEIVKVTGISGTTFTVSRGEDGTTAVSHSAGVDVALRVTAGTLEDLRDGGQVYTAGSGLGLSGNEFTNTAPDQTVSISGSGSTTVTGTYPSFTVSSTSYSHPSAHPISFITGLQTALDGKVDDSQVLTDVPANALFTDTVYTHPTNHSISFITGLQTALDGKVDDSQVLTNVPSGALFTDTVYTLPFTDNSSNWNTAYNWGDHSTGGYLTSHQSLSGYATETYVGNQITALVDSSPATMDTLNELAAALGDDPNFATTVSTSIGTKLPLAGGTLTGALSGTTATFSGSVTAPSIRSSSGEFHVNRSSDGASAIRVDADGVVVIPSNYFYVPASQGSYFSSAVRFRGTIHNDTGTDVTIGDTLNVTEGIKLNGTTVIDASRNITAGTIQSTFGGNNYFEVNATNTGEAMTRYNNTTSNLWYTGIRSSSQLVGTTGYHIFSAAHGQTSFGITAAGSVVGAIAGTFWGSSNDGSGSGLDADLLDGIDSTGFMKQLSDDSSPNYTTPSSRRINPNATNPTNEHYAFVTFGNNGNVTGQLATHYVSGQPYTRGYNSSWSAWRTIWTNTNDGSGSGLDADLLDGVHGASFLRSDATDTASGSVSLRAGGSHLGNHEFAASSTSTGYSSAAIELRESNYTATGAATPPILGFHWGGVVASTVSMDSGGAILIRNNPGTAYENFRAANIYANGTHLVWHTGNDGSGSGLDADLLDGQQGSYYAPATGGSYLPLAGGTLTGNLNTSGSGNYVLIGGSAGGNAYNTVPATTGLMFGGANDPNNYSIGTSTQNIGGNYTKLNIKWHTGIRFFSMPQYGGTRFYSDAAMSTETFSINNLDGHVRAANNLYANGGNLVWNASNDGSGSGLDADLLDGQQGSYYDQSQFTGVTFTSRNSGNPIAIDNVTTNMVGYVNTSTAAGYADGAGFSAAYSSSWVGQLFVDFRTGKLSTRGKNNGTWQAHRFMWDNLNDGSGSGLDADLLDGQQGSYYAPNTSLGNYVAKNANTMTGSAFKMGFHSGSGGTTFGANHYSMGVDIANSAWSNPNYSDLIIGYHTGIRIGGGYSGVRFYNNSPTTDANNDGNGDGGEALLMTIGGGGTSTSGAHVTVNNDLIAGAIRSDNFQENAGTFLFKKGSGSGRHRHLNLANTTSDPANVLDSQNPTGISWGTRSDNSAYYMLGLKGAYNNGYSTYSRLTLAWHTGIEIGAAAAYGGVRFMADTPFLNTTEIMSIGKSDSNVRVLNSLYANDVRASIFYDSANTGYYVDPNSSSYSFRGNGQANVTAGYISQNNPWSTGHSAFCPNGITTAGSTNWIYGHTYLGGAPSNGSGNEATAAGTIESTSWHKATVYYDRNDTGYYVDAASTSNINALGVQGTLTASQSTNTSYYTPNITSVAATNSAGVANYHLKFVANNGNANGSISTNYYQTTYATTSDYRAKEDFQPIINATSRLMSLNPVNFQWKDSDMRTDGFLAHEVAEVVSDAVVGEKDAVDEQGNDELQALDQSKLVPLLVKTIQEQQGVIEALEARISALEA